MQRVKIVEPFGELERVPSGSTLLDLALGGGWALARIANIVGDRSTGKTLAAIEAFANFNRLYGKKGMRYGEAESAFDDAFARTLGLPASIEKPKERLVTVEEYRDDLLDFMSKHKRSIYVLDSLDALSDDAEVARFGKKDKETGEDKGSYGTAKAKKLSEMFRTKVVRAIEEANCCHIIISQIRDRIGVAFGETKQRSGGRALDFYASQIVWLAEIKKLKRKAMGIERAVGVNIEAYVKKCKVGTPFRKVRFDIIFGYGIDDEQSMIDFLYQAKVMNSEMAKEIEMSLDSLRARQDRAGLKQIADNLKLTTRETWDEIEARLAPPMRKY